jgi:hypothetical protein
MELENFLKGLRPAAISALPAFNQIFPRHSALLTDIAAEHVNLSSKRFSHLVCSTQVAFTFLYWFSMINIPGKEIERKAGIKQTNNRSYS